MNVEFIWSEKQQKAFDKLKVIMAKKLVVKIFDLKMDITLTIDAGEHSSLWTCGPAPSFCCHTQGLLPAT